MQFVILGVLLSGPAALYDLHKHFTAGISLFYSASFGSIQRALRQLEAQGWATPVEDVSSRRRRKSYAISDTGREAWRAWMLAPVTGSDAEQTMLAKVFLLGHLPESDRAACLAVIRTRLAEDRDALASMATELDSATIRAEAGDTHRYRRATLDYGIRSHALALSWIDEMSVAR